MILFYDDERLFARPYVDALREAGHKVQYVDGIGAACTYCDNHTADIEIAIIDIMAPLPPRPLLSKKAQSIVREGSRMGLIVIGHLCKTPIGLAIPKIVLTNDPDRELTTELAGTGVIRILVKADTLPLDLVLHVRTALKGGIK